MATTLIKILFLLISVPAFSQMGGFFGMQANNQTPNNVPGVLGWWRASSISGVAGGGNVVTFPNVKGTGNHLVQNTATNQGTYQTNVVNGRPVLRLDGVDNYYNLTTNINSTLPAMVILVYKKSATGAFFVTFGTEDASTNPYMYFSFSNNATYSWSRGNAFINTTNPVDDYSGFAYAVQLAKTSNADVVWFKGTLQAMTTGTGTGGTTAYPQVFKRLTDYASGDIAELVYVNAELSTQNRQIIENYFKKLYGL